MRPNARLTSLAFAVFSSVASQVLGLEPEQIWELVSPSCVRIEATQLDGTESLGTGFAFEIDGKKYILSNRHVVLGANRVRIGHDTKHVALAPSYRICADLDLAIIELPEKFTVAAAKKRVGPLRTGERAYAIGFPLGLNKSITQGLVNSHDEEVVQFDAPISSGNSGGPLVDKDGCVIGVVTAGARGDAGEVVQNFNLAINIAYVPKARLFVDPVVSFYDAWLKLAEFESRVISEISDANVLEVREYLTLEVASLLFSGDLDDESKLDAEIFLSRLGLNGGDLGQIEPETLQLKRAQVLQKIQAVSETFDHAIARALGVLRRNVSAFDTVPKFFIGLGRQSLLEQYVKDKRGDISAIVRLDVGTDDIVPLLTLSMAR